MVMNGKCDCGNTTITVDASPSGQIACHCKSCQRTSGAPFSSNILVPEAAVKISGPVKEFLSKAASGNDVTRTFCGSCGSAIAHNSKAFGDSMAVQTGNLLGAAALPFEAELFVKDRFEALVPFKNAKQMETA